MRDAVIGVEEAWACDAGVREGVVDGGVRGVISVGGLEEVDGDGRGRGGGGGLDVTLVLGWEGTGEREMTGREMMGSLYYFR